MVLAVSMTFATFVSLEANNGRPAGNRSALKRNDNYDCIWNLLYPAKIYLPSSMVCAVVGSDMGPLPTSLNACTTIEYRLNLIKSVNINSPPSSPSPYTVVMLWAMVSTLIDVMYTQTRTHSKNIISFRNNVPFTWFRRNRRCTLISRRSCDLFAEASKWPTVVWTTVIVLQPSPAVHWVFRD